MYYLTYYEAYPIYEPAEGGYYYEGRNCIEWANSENLTEVIDYISEMANNLDLEIWRDNNDYDDIVDRLADFGATIVAMEHTKYIGNDRYLRLETESEFQKFESHWHPYE